MSDGWIENSNRNWVWLCAGSVQATVYSRDDGKWGGIWNGASDGLARRLKGTFDNAEEAQFAIETGDSEGSNSEKWWPPDEQWIQSKKGGYYRKVDGVVVSVKQAKSKSWYAVKMGGAILGQNGHPHWFGTAEEACHAVNAAAVGSGAWQWLERH